MIAYYTEHATGWKDVCTNLCGFSDAQNPVFYLFEPIEVEMGFITKR
jgi:hypothetical protein